MYVSDDRRMVYLASPKTATKATAEFLRSIGFAAGVHLPPDHPCRVCGMGNHAHHQSFVTHPGPEWTVMTTVRNHWDTLVSWHSYQKAGTRGEEFDERYIARLVDGLPVYYPDPNRLWWAHAQWSDVILRYETLEADLAAVLGRAVTLPRLNVSEIREGRPYQEYYSPALRDYVGQRFKEEVLSYGYTFD